MGCCATISKQDQASISLHSKLEDHTPSPHIPAQPQPASDKSIELTAVSRPRLISVMGYNESIQKEFQEKRESMLSNKMKPNEC